MPEPRSASTAARWPATGPDMATILDITVAGLLCALGEVEVWSWWGLGGIGVPDPAASRMLEALLVAAATAPLAWRRRRPLAALAVTAATVIVQVVAVTPSVSLVAGLLPLLMLTFSVAAHASWGGRLAGLLLTAMAEATFVAVIPEERIPNEVAFGLIVISGSWLLGVALRRRLRRVDGALAEAERRAAEQRTAGVRMLADERSRIARELHDVIAHGVSVMGVQSAAARLVLDRDPEHAKEMLLAVEEQARESIDELQRLLNVLRSTDDETDRRPQPGLGTLPQLVTTMRQAGLRVDLTVCGEQRRLPAGADLTAYRIVQEALTNALRHAGPVAVSVELRWTPGELAIQVLDDGPPVTGVLRPGHGLVGMRERAALYGGTVAVAPRPAGGICVAAKLPVGASAA